jgi:phage baseplate assembly protein gpV
MANLVDNKGQALSGSISYPVHAKVIENDSDDYKGHVRLKLLGMAESEGDAPETQWVRLLSPMGCVTEKGGNGSYGFYCLPDVDEVLVILFDRGDQSSAMVLGSYWSKTDPPPAEAKDGMPGASKTDTGGKKSKEKFTEGSTNLKKNDRRLWKSRSGHIFCFDDTDGKESIQIWDKSYEMCIAFDSKKGNLFFTNAKNDIHIRTKNDLYLEAGNDILVQAGNNMEVDTGKDYKLTAGSNFKVKATSNAEVEATSAYKGKGATVAVEADSSATFKGGASATFEGGMSATLKGGTSAAVTAATVSIN